jgi:hypothetical protein
MNTIFKNDQQQVATDVWPLNCTPKLNAQLLQNI